MKMRMAVGLLVVLGAGRLLASEPLAPQYLEFKKGWSLFTLKVTPEQDAAAFFADWPLAKAGAYDGQLAQETTQYSVFQSTEGAISDAWLLYVPGNPDLTTLKRLSANTTCLVLLTNSYYTTVWGTPVAARNALHSTASNVLNYVQISLKDPTDKVTVGDYFAGLDAGKWTAFDLYGNGDQPSSFPLTASSVVTGSKTLAMTCSRASDWSGPLYVSPRDGLEFGADGSLAALEVRNDSSTVCTYRVTLEKSVAKDLAFASNLYLRVTGDAGTNTSWQTLAEGSPYAERLEAGATATLTFGFDRRLWTSLPEATALGGLLHVDADGPTHFRTTVPVTAVAGGEASVTNAWPTGVWVVDATLDEVSYVKNETETTTPIPAGGKMKVRLLLTRAPDDAMFLRSRVTDGSVRLSSAVLPADMTRIPCVNPTNGTVCAFGERAVFAWRVSETSTSNPFYHARHPDHDGLATDFATRAPSGDVFENYLGTVKPELFSIDNTVELVWDASTATVWNPQDSLTGTIAWRFSGLRREGELQATGTFTMRRLSSYNPGDGE